MVCDINKNEVPYPSALEIEVSSVQKYREHVKPCTRMENKEEVEQDSRFCKTCFPNDNSKHICAECADRCHGDHDLTVAVT